jgi:DNA-binding transcriptional LysR family regulator
MFLAAYSSAATLELVATTDAVCISPESMAKYYAHPELGWRPIVDIEPLRIALAWPRDSTNPLVGKFVRIVAPQDRRHVP